SRDDAGTQKGQQQQAIGKHDNTFNGQPILARNLEPRRAGVKPRFYCAPANIIGAPSGYL
ncbi:MAG: hypothetical protein AB7U92_23645, partial [Piscinibacter sp.]|uniref:hypothetical protein n=1 Tax=Piscinibacter sp. TaxID=1903157 RepID=UPI003D0E32D7